MINGLRHDSTTISAGEPDFTATRFASQAAGKLGIVGIAAEIGKAVDHTIGKRGRNLPITMEKLLV
nr:hypothetical protein [uncultured Acidocella sp.]